MATIKRINKGEQMIFEDFPFAGDVTKIVKMRQPAPVFVRFGRFSQKSFNWSTGESEAGLSVYPATLVDGVAVIDSEWLDDIADAWEILEERIKYVVTGRVVGEGSDGEPVLAPSSVVIRGVEHQRFYEGYFGIPIQPIESDRIATANKTR